MNEGLAMPTVTSTDFKNGTLNSNFATVQQKIKYAVTEVVGKDLDEIEDDVQDYFYLYVKDQFKEDLDNDPHQPTNCYTPCECFNGTLPTVPTTAQHIPDNYFPDNILKLWCGDSPPTPSGNFPVTFRYRLPGLGQYSSEKVVTLVK